MKVRSLFAAFGGITIVLCLVGWLDQPADPSAAPNRPDLSVTLDNARTSTRAGDLVTYTTEVRNSEPVARRLVVTQLLPSAYDMITASPKGRSNARKVSWTASLDPGEALVLRTKGRVGEPAEGYAQLAASSCVGLPSAPMTACASDTDPLAVANSPTGGRALLIGGLVIGAVVVTAAGLIRLLERRNPATSAASSGSAGSAASSGSAGSAGSVVPAASSERKGKGPFPEQVPTVPGMPVAPSVPRTAMVPAPRVAAEAQGDPFVRPEWIRPQPPPWHTANADSPELRELVARLGSAARISDTDRSGNARSPPDAAA